MGRNSKGSVTVCSRRGRLNIRLPRQLYGGQQKYLSLGLPDTPLNRKVAQGKAQAIAADIAYERFDFSLDSYRLPSQPPAPEAELLELWQLYVKFKQQHLAPSSLKNLTTVGNHIGNLPTHRLTEVDARRIRHHLQHHLTQESARRALMQINACCNWAIEEGLIESNPFAAHKRLKRVKKVDIDPFTVQERELILHGFRNSNTYACYASFVEFLFLTGCRLSEAIALKWKHIAPGYSTITFTEAVVERVRKGTKTGTTRRFPANDSLKTLLREQPEQFQQAPVFRSPTGKVIDAHNFSNRAWRGVLGNLPIRYRKAYNTRHTFITLCLEAGVPISQVAAWVGNSPEVILKHYAGLTRSEVPEL